LRLATHPRSSRTKTGTKGARVTILTEVSLVVNHGFAQTRRIKSRDTSPRGRTTDLPRKTQEAQLPPVPRPWDYGLPGRTSGIRCAESPQRAAKVIQEA